MSDINISDYSSYTINNINAQCHDYYPTCVHDVTIILNNNFKFNIFMKCEEIANYYQYNNINIPFHFTTNLMNHHN
jgi:hypothetical protein